MIFGVCRGVAQYFDLSLFWVRIAFVAGFLFSGFFPVGVLYIFMALLMKKEPYWRTIY